MSGGLKGTLQAVTAVQHRCLSTHHGAVLRCSGRTQEFGAVAGIKSSQEQSIARQPACLTLSSTTAPQYCDERRGLYFSMMRNIQWSSKSKMYVYSRSAHKVRALTCAAIFSGFASSCLSRPRRLRDMVATIYFQLEHYNQLLAQRSESEPG